MQEIYRNVSKVMVSSRSGSNLLYLPLDKLMQPGAQPGAGQPVQPAAEPAAGTSAPIQIESRGRDAQRSRERESR
jgi:membrane protease subunit HflK